ncbi:MAG TPA: polar amino acid ABC transporter permease [Lachnospiraceae bacterium]|nr:polar amino acid ABC transporter permease [Lachnospiraceae bacterium]
MSVGKIAIQLLNGSFTSIMIFFLTLLFSLPLGLIVALLRLYGNKLVSGLIKLYISVMRGTPLMLQLMVVFFGPYYLFGIKIKTSYRFAAVIIGFVLNYAAYFAEIYRGGIEAVPKGQYEAAEVLGYSKTQTFIRIILPQVIKTVLPSITNEVITLVKDTSLAFVIAVSEMFTQAKAIAAAQTTMMPFIIAGVFYYVFNFLVAFVMGRIEKKMEYGTAPAAMTRK